MHDINFIAIDFETASNAQAAICEAGISIVKGGKVVETRSWLVRPEGNAYNYWNTRVHGITAKDTAHAPEFPQVWDEIMTYLADCPILVAHNAGFDMGCIRRSLAFYGLKTPEITYYCSLRAARKIYDFECNKLEFLCQKFEIPYGQHHRAGDDAAMCAHLFLRELKDFGWADLSEMHFCEGKL